MPDAPATAAPASGLLRTGVVRGQTVLLDPGPALPNGVRVTVAAGDAGGAAPPRPEDLPGFGAWREHAVELDALLEETERARRLPRLGSEE